MRATAPVTRPAPFPVGHRLPTPPFFASEYTTAEFGDPALNFSPRAIVLSR